MQNSQLGFTYIPESDDYDIMGLSGATISSWSITAGAKKALIIIEDVI